MQAADDFDGEIPNNIVETLGAPQTTAINANEHTGLPLLSYPVEDHDMQVAAGISIEDYYRWELGFGVVSGSPLLRTA